MNGKNWKNPKRYDSCDAGIRMAKLFKRTMVLSPRS